MTSTQTIRKTMSKKDKAQEQQASVPVESPTVVTLADVLEIMGITKF